jgi:hypothetical protein
LPTTSPRPCRCVNLVYLVTTFILFVWTWFELEPNNKANKLTWFSLILLQPTFDYVLYSLIILQKKKKKISFGEAKRKYVWLSIPLWCSQQCTTCKIWISNVCVMNLAGTISQLLKTGESECSVIMLWTYTVAAFSLTIWSAIFMWLVA